MPGSGHFLPRRFGAGAEGAPPIPAATVGRRRGSSGPTRDLGASPAKLQRSCVFIAPLCVSPTTSPVRVLGENVIAVLRQCVAREPALRVVALRRSGRLGGGAERIGRCVVVE
jgi:hypothetical protein